MTTDHHHQQSDSSQDAGQQFLAVDLDVHMLIKSPNARQSSEAAESASRQATVVALLQALYYVESRSVVRYLSNWQPYTSAATARLRTRVKKMSEESYAHADRLSSMLEIVGGGETREGLFREENTHFNYDSWATILPRLIAAKTAIIHNYETALVKLGASDETDDPIVDELRSLLDENQRHLDALSQWSNRV